jgi:shikimate kinase/3-dehydroquinate synthase
MTRSFLPLPPLPPGRPRLVVAGYPAAGKTEAGRRAAELLGLPFVDLDHTIEKRAGRSVSDIFAGEGESTFRALEQQVVEEAAALSGTVIATGGGSVLQPGFARLVEDSVGVVLTADLEALNERLSEASSRPLLARDPAGGLRRLVAERTEAYAAAGRALDTTMFSVDDVAAELVRAYRQAASPIRVDVAGPGGAYPVVVAPIDQLADELARVVGAGTSTVVVTDRAVSSHTAARVRGALADRGVETELVDIASGEAAKSIETVADLWTRFRTAGLERSGTVVAVGGGATLDTAGFAAATYARGVDVINVPTSLLAMLDAALGGKVGIDHAGIKNLVGAFHHPKLVVVDPSTLDSLPSAIARQGVAEGVKAALLVSPLLIEVLEDAPLDGRGLPRHLDWLIEQAVRIKAAYVAADPADVSVRHALNLGHTFAHAIEAASSYRISHGDAVAVGLVAAARLGAARGISDVRLPGRLEALLARFGLTTSLPGDVPATVVVDAMAADKKRRGGELVFVVPVYGGVEIVPGVDRAEAIAAVEPRAEALRT